MIVSRVLHAGIVAAYVNYFEQLDPELGRKKREFAQAVIHALEWTAAARLRFTSAAMACSVEEAGRAAEDLHARGVDVIVVLPLIAAFGELLLAAAGPAAMPVLALSIASECDVPTSYTMAQMVAQSGGLGMQALCNTLNRHERDFEVRAGALDEEDFLERVSGTLRALTVPAILRRSRLGLIGTRFASITDVELDLKEVRQGLGIECVEIAPGELALAYRSQEPGAVRRAVEERRNRFSIRAISDDELERSVRLSLALEQLLATHGIDFGPANSHCANRLQNDEIGAMATPGVNLLTSRGVPMAEVGDAPNAIAMAMAKRLAGTPVYGELVSIDFASSSWFIANSGELDLNAGAQKPGSDHQYQFGGFVSAVSPPAALRDREGRHQRSDRDAGPGMGSVSYPGERDRARLY